MTLTEIIRERRSVRRFEQRPVPREVLERILGLALAAPSSKNVRSSRFIVIDRPELLEQIALMRDSGSAFLKDAPCGVMVLGDSSVSDLWVDNASISATFLQLAAQDAGLGSCWVHINDRPRLKAQPDGEQAADYLRTFLPIDPNWQPLCIVALGYADGEAKPHSATDDSDKVMWL